MFALLQWYHFKSSMLQMIQKFLGFYIVLGYELMLTYCSLSGFNSASYINPWSLPAKAPEHFAIHPKEDEILFQSHHFSGTFAVKLFGEVNPIDFFPGKFLWYCWWNKSCDHQLTLVLYAIIYRVFIHSRWLAVFFSINPRNLPGDVIFSVLRPLRHVHVLLKRLQGPAHEALVTWNDMYKKVGGCKGSLFFTYM